VRHDPARRAGDRGGARDHGRVRVLRRAAQAREARGPTQLERQRVRLRARLGGGVRLLRRERHVRAGRAPAHAPVRHDAGSPGRGRRRATQVGQFEPRGPDARAAAHARGLPPLALDRRAVPSLRLLPGLERRPRRHRDRPRAGARFEEAPGLHPRHGAGAPGRRPLGHALLGRRAVARAGAPHGRPHAPRRGRGGALRLLHLHRARDARGLRLLRQGRGRPLRGGGRERPRRPARGEHRRRPALELLHVGHDAGLGRRHPGARRGRAAPLVSGNGGVLSTHSTLILAREPS